MLKISGPLQEMVMQSKICNECGVEKRIHKFHKHLTGKFGVRSICKDCSNKKSREYYKLNAAKICKRTDEYRKDNIEKARKWGRDYYYNNIEKRRSSNRKYLELNKEYNRGRAKVYRENNPEKVKEKERQYREENKELLNQKWRRWYRTEAGQKSQERRESRRKALKNNTVTDLTSRDGILNRDGYICQRCKRKTRPDFKNYNHPLYPNVDHIVPLSLGGTDTADNKQCLCHKCNVEKHNTGTGDQLRMFG